jgi:hypothetical protein
MLTGLHAIVFTPEAGSPCGATKTLTGLCLLWIAVVDDDLVEGLSFAQRSALRCRRPEHAGALETPGSPQRLPTPVGCPGGATLTIWERVREERARCSRESRNPGAVLMILARLRHCAMNALIRSIGTILTPFSVRKQPHRRMCSGLMPMPMKRPVRWRKGGRRLKRRKPNGMCCDGSSCRSFGYSPPNARTWTA